MGALIITLLINELVRKRFGYDARGSVIGFATCLFISVGIASWGFSDDSARPLQVLPYVALGYGKFCLAYLIIDLYNAKRIRIDPEYLKTRTSLGFKPNLAWVPAAGVIAAGAAISFLPPLSPSHTNPTPQVEIAPATPWQAISSPEGLFTSLLPGIAAESSDSLPTKSGSIGVHSFDLETSNGFYAIQYMRFADSQIDPSATVERVLESTRDGMIRNTRGLILNERYLEHKGWPGLEASFQAVEGRDTLLGKARIIVAGRTLYTLIAIGSADNDAIRFFESFEIQRAFDTFRLPSRPRAQ